jgi:hypothetical protein
VIDDRLRKTFVRAKGYSVIAMIAIHSLCMIGIHSKMTILPGADGAWSYLPLFGFYSLCLPILAGAIFRNSMDSHMLRGQLLSVPWIEVGKIAYLLILVEGLKNIFFGFRLSLFFSWNVLQCVALSYFIICLLLRQSMKLLVAGAIASSLLAAWVSASPPQFDLGHLAQSQLFLNTLAGCYALVLSLLLFTPWIWSSYKKSKIPSALFALASAIGFLIFSFLKIGQEIRQFPKDFAGLVNLPIAMWVGDSSGFHYWPALNWFPLIAFGFLFFHHILAFRSLQWLKIIHLASSAIFICYAAFFFKTDFAPKVDSLTLFTAQLFSISLATTIGIGAFFVMNFIAIWLVSANYRTHRKGIVAMFSKYILFIYIFHAVLIALLVKPILLLNLGVGISAVLLICLLLFTSYAFALVLDRSAVARESVAE